MLPFLKPTSGAQGHFKDDEGDEGHRGRAWSLLGPNKLGEASWGSKRAFSSQLLLDSGVGKFCAGTQPVKPWGVCVRVCACTEQDPALPPGHVLRNCVPSPTPTSRLSQGDSKALPTLPGKALPSRFTRSKEKPFASGTVACIVSRKEGQPGPGK